MGGVFAAYLLTVGVVTYRWSTGPKEMPPPMALLGTTMVFSACGLIAQADKKFGSTAAWAFLIGALAAPKSNIAAVQRLGGVPAATVNNGVGPSGDKTGTASSYPNGSITTSKPPFPGGPTQMPEPGQHIYGQPNTGTGKPPSSITPPTQALPGPAPTPPAGG